ncbi:DNA replication/checkpoint protein [Naviculisporaceae sp. PSN 640]
MNDHDRSSYELQCQKLRAELKQWESDWARTTGGKKPSREDIKQNREISNKYKEYNKLRDILAGKTKPPSTAPRDEATSKRQQQKRKQDDAVLPPSQTPQKRSKCAQTPSKSQTYADVELSAAVTPSLSRKLFSPALPTSIGPTPQRDGKVLGLFDLLSATPSSSAGDDARTNLNARRVDATPSKRNGSADALVNDETLTTPSADRLNRTPSSTRHNKMLLDELPGFTTPLHKRDRNSQPNKTPSSRSGSGKLHFATPAFLRRTTAPLPALDENGEWKIEPIKLPRKPLVRGLSNMVASLRKLEEEALDEELEAMREMEEMEGGVFAHAPSRKPKHTNTTKPTTGAGQPGKGGSDTAGATAVSEGNNTTENGESGAQTQTQQQQRPERPVLLGGFDDEDLFDSQDEEQLDRGQPLRVFKKKGQKRTTRRVNIRPIRFKGPSAPTGEDDDSDGVGGNEVVPETQFDSTKLADGQEGDDALLQDGPDSEGGSDFEHDNDDHDYDDDDVDETKKKKTNKKDTKTTGTAKSTAMAKKEKQENDKDGNGEGIIRKGIRKVKATAHANFKRLKLKNNGAKGGPGHNSRFRRRR